MLRLYVENIETIESIKTNMEKGKPLPRINAGSRGSEKPNLQPQRKRGSVPPKANRNR